MNTTDDVRGMFEELEETVMKGRACKDGPATTIKLFDVEDYLSDGQPFAISTVSLCCDAAISSPHEKSCDMDSQTGTPIQL